MITRSTVVQYTAGDGSKHDSLEAAQKADLIVLLSDELAGKLDADGYGPVVMRVADALLAKSKHVVDILTTKPNSLPKCRSVNGGTKKRAPRKHIAPQPPLPLPEQGEQAGETNHSDYKVPCGVI